MNGSPVPSRLPAIWWCLLSNATYTIRFVVCSKHDFISMSSSVRRISQSLGWRSSTCCCPGEETYRQSHCYVLWVFLCIASRNLHILLTSCVTLSECRSEVFVVALCKISLGEKNTRCCKWIGGVVARITVSHCSGMDLLVMPSIRAHLRWCDHYEWGWKNNCDRLGSLFAGAIDFAFHCSRS